MPMEGIPVRGAMAVLASVCLASAAWGRIPYGANALYDQSSFGLGSVTLNVFFMESNGVTDPSSEDWTAAQLNNPHVVKIYDVVQAGRWPWIVMEYVKSRSLQEIIRDDGPLSPQRTASIGLARGHQASARPQFRGQGAQRAIAEPVARVVSAIQAAPAARARRKRLRISRVTTPRVYALRCGAAAERSTAGSSSGPPAARC